ncbi:MAG: YggT family protein [Gammaproteobacteria bacterium]|nr:YggT family protein [Gammaproteobacteria bacterium]
MTYLLQAGVTLVQFVIGLYLLLLLLRFIFQLVRADFYNPISQSIVKITNPPLRLLRKFVPGFAGIDWPSVILLFAVQALELILVSLLIHATLPTPLSLLVLCLAHLLKLTAYVYMFFIMITVVISWVNPGAYNPLTVLIHQVTEPLMKQVRKRIPATAGLDWSPMVVLLGIYLFLSLVVAPLMDLGTHLAI